MSNLVEIPVLFPDNASLSGPIDVGRLRLVGVKVPAGWVTAAITFQALVLATNATPPAETYGDVKDEAAAELSLGSAVASTYIAVVSKRIQGLNRIKVRSGVTATPVSQTGGPLTLLLVMTDD